MPDKSSRLELELDTLPVKQFLMIDGELVSVDSVKIKFTLFFFFFFLNKIYLLISIFTGQEFFCKIPMPT